MNQPNQTNYPNQEQFAYGQLQENSEHDIPQGSPIAHSTPHPQQIELNQVPNVQQQVQQYPVYSPYVVYPAMPNNQLYQQPTTSAFVQNPVGLQNPHFHPQVMINHGQPQQQIQQPVTMTRHPQILQCPGCNQQTTSTVVYQNGTGTYVAGALIAACGFWVGCCLLPCLMDDCKDARHICSKCGNNLGQKRFIFE